MIFDAILTVVISLTEWAQSIIPEWAWVHPVQGNLDSYELSGHGWMQGSGEYITQICGWLAGWNAIFPISDVVMICGLVMSFFSVLASIKGAKWLIGVVRGAGTT